MRLSDEMYEEIKQTVTDTFGEYDIHCIPISGFEMAVTMGLKVVPYSVMEEKQREAAKKISEDGFSLETEDGEWRIFFNDESRTYQRINNTIMHEIGHYALGHTQEGDDDEKESEANFFAKYALAPPPLIHAVCSKVTVESIMKMFDISYQAAGHALRYYKNWLKYGKKFYTGYEKEMLELFKCA